MYKMAKGNVVKVVNAFDRRTWDDAEEAYFKYVDSMIADAKDEIFSNGKAWHAAYLIFKFLELASEQVRIFSGTLVQKTPQGVAIYSAPKIIDAASAFLRKESSRLQVVLEKDIDAPDPNEHPLVQSVKRMERDGSLHGTLEIRRLNDDTVASLQERDALHHMMLVDDRRWRIEIDPNPNDVQAVVNAGSCRETRALNQAFDTVLWRNGDGVVSIGKNDP